MYVVSALASSPVPEGSAQQGRARLSSLQISVLVVMTAILTNAMLLI